MGRIRLVLLAFTLIAVDVAAIGRASAAEWPAQRQFVLVEPPGPLAVHPPPSSVAEERDGGLLVLMHWPVNDKSGALGRTRLVRLAADGSRAFVPPFGESDPGSPETPLDVRDEILPLADGSILFTRYNAVDRLRPDGSIVRFAGTGRYYGETARGDGGPATAADIGFAQGLSRFPDGSIVFGTDVHRVRRVAPDGIITTLAGTGEFGFGGDGGAATAAQLRFPSDALPTEDGGFLIADSYNGRVRRVNSRGVISTVAGTGRSGPLKSSGDGGPAAAAALALPAHLARLPDGSLLIGESRRIRRVSSDGTISTIFDARPVHADRLGDFAGRYGNTIEAMDVTREGGIAVIVAGPRLRALYLAPRRTRHTLVALRGARASQRQVKVTVDTTTRGRLRLQVRRAGEVVADATRHAKSGRHVIAVAQRFATAYHDVRVTLRTNRGGYRDDLRVFTSDTLPRSLVDPTLGKGSRCSRIDARRIDCETHNTDDEEGGKSCLNTSAYRLFSSGLLFTRPYGPRCHRRPRPFNRNPRWSDPWQAWPPR